MWWQVRASFEDRPGRMAAVATLCGRHEVNILGLQIFPDAGGVVDEFVVCTPGGWDGARVAQLFARAGVRDALVAETMPEILEDQPTRYLRSAELLVGRPHELVHELCRLLDAELDEPDDPGEPGEPGEPDEPGVAARCERLILEDAEGPAVRLRRRVPFTDTEVARARALRALAARRQAALSGAAAMVAAVDGAPLGSGDDAALRRAASEAADRGEQELRFLVRDVHSALAALHAAGLRARVTPVPGVVEVAVPVGGRRPART